MLTQSIPLYEKYRPRSLDEVVGQDGAIEQLRFIQKRSGSFAGNAFWFVGPSGSGKTTLARIIASTVAGPLSTVEFNAGSDITPGIMADLLRSMDLYGMDAPHGRAFIVNESHSLRSDVLETLKGALEPVSGNCIWCFTTTRADQEQLFGDHVGAGQLLSRCKQIGLTNQGLAKSFASMLCARAKLEGLDGLPESAYVKLLQRPDVKNNCRAAWNLIESGVMLAGGVA